MKTSISVLTLAAMLAAGGTVLAAPTADQVAAEAAADPGASAAYRTPAKGSASAKPATKAAKAQPPKPQSSDLQARYVESKDIFQTASLRNTYVSPDYRLFRGDTMSLLVVGFPDGIGIDKITVGLDGYVQLPYVGSVKMEGLTLDEAKQVVLNSLNQYLRVPDLTLMITKYGPRKVYVMGEVKKPGIQDMTIDNMNAYAALASAGGWARKGRSTRVQILRVIDGVMYYRTLNMKAYTVHHDLTQNVALENGDILYVPKTNGIKFDTDVMPYINAWSMYKALTD
ncbi:MAG: polysaccharide biosynthesis/export family protein [Selenomonadaceae bacterium]|nr:polysaccharide biosynthesis/export family protein [Selenomonadaceae bacterium]